MCDKIYANAEVTTDQRFNSKNNKNPHDNIYINENKPQTGSTRIDQNKKNSGCETAGSRLYRGITVGLLLLCVLLLAIIIVLAVKNKNLTTDNNQLQTSYKDLIKEKKQLQKEKDKCVVSNLEQMWGYKFGSSRYYFSTGKKDWTESRNDCKERKADLVTVNSREKLNFIMENLVCEHVWVGLSQASNEGKWTWEDNTELNTTSE
ncbi:CD209 antigen-like protein E [Trichomycterus rosablanca]|uniref:CD209 antigen-like protein E n=1 Tax=Trichomycterus rosablanca TaxID=2290929 RepID=UPI002F3603F6